MQYSKEQLLEDNVEAVIELIKKAYESTKRYYEDKKSYDFLYFDVKRTFTKGYCYEFAKFLLGIYKDAKLAVYDINYATFCHIYTVIGNSAYDVNGKKLSNNLSFIDDSTIKVIEENHNAIPNEVYLIMKNYLDNYLEEYISYHKSILK